MLSGQEINNKICILWLELIFDYAVSYPVGYEIERLHTENERLMDGRK